MAGRGRLFAGLSLVVAAVAQPPAAVAQVSETQVKAAFLPRFARYVSWPTYQRPRAGQPFLLCVIGGDPFGSAIERAAAGQTIDGHRVVVRRLQSGGDGCHVAFVDGTKTHPTGQLLKALEARPVLTVTDARSGAQRGIIHFTIIAGRVRFFIDEKEAARRGLGINSRLLALAVEVRAR